MICREIYEDRNRISSYLLEGVRRVAGLWAGLYRLCNLVLTSSNLLLGAVDLS